MYIDILLGILLFVLIILGVYSIYSLSKLNTAIHKAAEDMNRISEKTLPLLDDLENIAGKISLNVDEADDWFKDIKTRIRNFTDKFNKIKSSESLTDPIGRAEDLVKNIKAVSSGLRTFWNALKK